MARTRLPAAEPGEETFRADITAAARGAITAQVRADTAAARAVRAATRDVRQDPDRAIPADAAVLAQDLDRADFPAAEAVREPDPVPLPAENVRPEEERWAEAMHL